MDSTVPAYVAESVRNKSNLDHFLLKCMTIMWKNPKNLMTSTEQDGVQNCTAKLLQGYGQFNEEWMEIKPKYECPEDGAGGGDDDEDGDDEDDED